VVKRLGTLGGRLFVFDLVADGEIFQGVRIDHAIVLSVSEIPSGIGDKLGDAEFGELIFVADGTDLISSRGRAALATPATGIFLVSRVCSLCRP
jgi:hypothetical protein